MAPFVHVGAAISGAGATFSASIYVHPLHTSFTTLPAASIVGTNRGKRLNIILSPADAPSNTYTGRLACPLPEIGGLAATRDPWNGGLLSQVVAGTNLLAYHQKLLGYNTLERKGARTDHDTRSDDASTCYLDGGATHAAHAHRFSHQRSPAWQESLATENYFRTFMRTDDRYALINHWRLGQYGIPGC